MATMDALSITLRLPERQLYYPGVIYYCARTGCNRLIFFKIPIIAKGVS